MSGEEFIDELKAMSDLERETIFATLQENPEWREDRLDLIAIADGGNEPTRSIDEVFEDLNIRGLYPRSA